MKLRQHIRYFYGQLCRFGLVALLIGCLTGCQYGKQPQLLSIEAVMDSLVTRLYAQLDSNQLDTIGQDFILSFLTSEERDALASNYWRFDVNVPVLVSVMRDQAQEIPPFWLKEAGFEKTTMLVRNELYTYEVWQKEFPKGEIGLGINGFDRHRPVYFVGLSPQDPGDVLHLASIFPEKQHVDTMQVGAFTYHDWDELVLSDVPDQLDGQFLLTTIRGRAREAHLMNAFRKTLTPSSMAPDQIRLTWSNDPAQSMTVQWRGGVEVEGGRVIYWTTDNDTLVCEAEFDLLEDRLLLNDRYVKRFVAKLTGLKPGTTYQYVVKQAGHVSTPQSFETPAPDNRFSFVWFGDVHNDPRWGNLLKDVARRLDDVSFYVLAGDLVNTGLHRDDWDAFFDVSGDVFQQRPVMSVPGNHDSQDGLGASLYSSLLTYPGNGPEGSPSGLTYSFCYKNAQFLMIDAVSFSAESQTEWITTQLAESTATWKFAVFHFPPYTAVEDYADITAHWIPIFDLYEVDMVMNGHFHYYLRTKPMRAGKPTAAKGTTYIMSVGTKGKNQDIMEGHYADRTVMEGYLFQHIQISGDTLVYTSKDSANHIVDYFKWTKE